MNYLLESIRMTDVRTLIYALVWESFSITMIILIFYKYSALGKDRSDLIKNALLQVLYTFAFLLLYGRNHIPIWLSSTVGNLLLFLAFYIELKQMLHAMHIKNKHMNNYLTILVILSCSAYLLQDIVLGKANYRIALSSLIIFLFFFPFIVFVLLRKGSLSLHRFAACTSLPLAIASVPRMYVAITAPESYSLFNSDTVQVALFLSFLLKFYCTSIFFFLFLKIDADEEIRLIASTDSLTGMLNRQTYLQRGDKLFKRCQYAGDMIGIFFLDIDSFKRINDQYGHSKGDEILTAFGRTISQHLRPQDIFGRYGGDEFSICLQLSSTQNGLMIANRIQSKIGNIKISDIRITASIGLAYGIPRPDDTFFDFIELADKAMYIAKNSGKNQNVALDMSEQQKPAPQNTL